MCPVCVANLALIAAISSGGLAAFAANKFHNRRQPNQRKTK
jgi:hypothetical protein